MLRQAWSLHSRESSRRSWPFEVQRTNHRRTHSPTHGFPAPFVIGYAARFGAKSIPVFLKGLERDDTAKQSVFGLAALGKPARMALESLLRDSTVSPSARRRATLALAWMKEAR